MEKYNGNIYLSTTPSYIGGGTEWTPEYYYYYLWAYIENGLFHYTEIESNTQKPYFETFVDDGISKYHTGIYLEGSGTSYSYIYNYNSSGIDENDNTISISGSTRITLEFSEDGNSAVWTKTIEENGEIKYTQNLVLTLFKE